MIAPAKVARIVALAGRGLGHAEIAARCLCGYPVVVAALAQAQPAPLKEAPAEPPKAARDVTPGESWAFTEHRSQAALAPPTVPWSDPPRVLPAAPLRQAAGTMPPPLRTLPPTPGGAMRFEDDPRAKRDPGSPGPISRAVATHRDSSLA